MEALRRELNTRTAGSRNETAGSGMGGLNPKQLAFILWAFAVNNFPVQDQAGGVSRIFSNILTKCRKL
jgi:hypothetical protein